MVEKFKDWYDGLDIQDKEEIIEYILKDPKMQSIVREHFPKREKGTPKGFFTGPVDTSGKCPHCGELL